MTRLFVVSIGNNQSTRKLYDIISPIKDKKNRSKGGNPMLQIHVESTKNPAIYRKFQVDSEQTLFELEYVIAAGFDALNLSKIKFMAKRRNGQDGQSATLMLMPENDEHYDTDEEILSDWLVQHGDEILFLADDMYELKIQLEQVLDEEVEFDQDICMEGQGNLLTNRKKKIDVDEINMKLSLKEAFDELKLEALDNMLEPDYAMLLELSSELNKMKPWQYFENREIIALELEEYDETVFVGIMGAGGQEFGLMIYDEDIGYTALSTILEGSPVTEDVRLNLGALVVNFVDRTELDAIDYQLTKDFGFSFRGKKNWMQFRSYLPATHPELPVFSEVEIMKLVISAMQKITKLCKQGWVYPVIEKPHAYPAFKVAEDGEIGDLYLLELEIPNKGDIEIDINDLERMQFKRKPKSALQLEFDLVYLPYTVEGEDGGRSIYPLMCVVMDRTTGEVFANEFMPVPKFPIIEQQMFWQLLSEMPVKPSKMFVTKNTKEHLAKLAKLLGVELVVSELPNIGEFKEFIINTPPDMLT